MSDTLIREHALLSDCGAAALVTSRGSVDWLCLPRFSSPAVFARLLDDDAGHFSLAPVGTEYRPTWTYRPDSLVLETTWTAPGSTLVVTDALALGSRERGHDLGFTSPSVLLRRAHCVQGTVVVDVDFAPRPEFGLVHPRLSRVPGAVVGRGGSTMLILSTDRALHLSVGRASAQVTLRPGEDLTFAVEHIGAWGEPARPWSPGRIRRRLSGTEASWRSWSGLHQSYIGPWQDLVRHSGRVLRGLTNARSGAVVAAATTSLPEGVGSDRTWDYRFTWVRDASMTLQGLFVAACPHEAGAFFDFIADAAGTQLERGLPLQIMFGAEGERDLHERELEHLRGWRDSGPVRVGNDAWHQHQLDVYGALLDASWTLRDQLSDMAASTRAFLVASVQAAVTRWQEDDQGIWEIRGPARPFVHSKLMCWVALDRGLALADLLGVDDRMRADWAVVRDEIRDAIQTRGWNDQRQAFSQSFGSSELDASVLLMAITGFLPADDERLVATVDAIEADLQDDRSLIFRYRGDDGLAQPEGTFLLCTFWLAHALAVLGQPARARAVLDRAAGYATDLGLFAEQVDPTTGDLWGNFPQAFSHLGFVNAAQAVADAEVRLDQPQHVQPT